MIKTFDEAYQFVLDHKVCKVFGSKGSPHPSLWDNTALSEKKPKAGGWSPKVVAVWDWKTRIPQTYPGSVYYGKIHGGDAVLMEMQYFRETHYPAAFQMVSELDALAQQVVRSNDPMLKNDCWLTMREMHLDIVHQYEFNSSNG